MAIKRMAREWTRARAMPFERARAARERAGTPGVRRARWSRARARRASSRSSPQPTAAAHAPHCWTSDQKLATPSLSRARSRSEQCVLAAPAVTVTVTAARAAQAMLRSAATRSVVPAIV
jgi:hypothetical protein